MAIVHLTSRACISIGLIFGSCRQPWARGTTRILMPIHAIVCGTIYPPSSAFKSISPVVNTTGILFYLFYDELFYNNPTQKQMSASTTCCSLDLQTFPSNLQLEDLNCLNKSTDRKHIV